MQIYVKYIVYRVCVCHENQRTGLKYNNTKSYNGKKCRRRENSIQAIFIESNWRVLYNQITFYHLFYPFLSRLNGHQLAFCV